jgi:hypothetical protein
MTESSIQSKKLQWKWVGITFVMYLLFYLLPLILVDFFSAKTAFVLIGCWIFGGIIIVAAVAGYLSEGVTIWEPAIAGAGLVLILFITLAMYFHIHSRPGITLFGEIAGILVPAIIVFLLSLFGAWLGERAQQLWKTKPPEVL